NLLSEFFDQKCVSVRPLLAQSGVNISRLKQSINSAIDRLPRDEGSPGDIHMSNDLGRVLNVAYKLAQQKKDAYISSELVLLVLFDVNNAVTALLKEAGVSKDKLNDAIDKVRGGESVDNPEAEGN